MPKELEHQLMKRAAELKLKGDRKNAYIYGTLNKVEKRKRGKKK